jgi:hypothetical protein
VSFIVCSFVCCVSFDCGVILCDVCCLFVVSYCKPLPPGTNPFAVNKYYITLQCLSERHKFRTEVTEKNVTYSTSLLVFEVSRNFCDMRALPKLYIY